MSRSRKRPYIQAAADKKNKIRFNRIIRRTNEDIGQYCEYKKHHNSWDICDWILSPITNQKGVLCNVNKIHNCRNKT